MYPARRASPYTSISYTGKEKTNAAMLKKWISERAEYVLSSHHRSSCSHARASAHEQVVLTHADKSNEEKSKTGVPLPKPVEVVQAEVMLNAHVAANDDAPKQSVRCQHLANSLHTEPAFSTFRLVNL